jgi:flagellar protein FlaI
MAAKKRGKKTKKKTVKRKKVVIKKTIKKVVQKKSQNALIVDRYQFESLNMPVSVVIRRNSADYVPVYEVTISSISQNTQLILEKIKQELVKEVNLGMVDIRDVKKIDIVEQKFSKTIGELIEKYFPDINEKTKEFFTTYLIQKSLGMGNIEILNDDHQLEEIVINSSRDVVWVYHRKHGWLRTNINVESEEKIKHYATTIGRRVGRQISILEPLLDAHLKEGDRVNATLVPISTFGNTITIRKFSRDPWTITSFLKFKTLSPNCAALIWLAMQYELSAIIAGGTASGKTSALNALANFFPPDQRIISIEDTRELRLPKYLHWVPMNTRLPNPEGKGAITMEDLLVNSLRMRPDRILVGEVRRKREAETLFEAIHTGHSCYATFHANNSKEMVDRFTNPPIDVPKTLMPAISLVITQFRNRRTGVRRTFQVAEILPDSSPNVLMQYDAKRDIMVNKNKSKSLMATLQMFTGNSVNEINREITEKEEVLKYMVKHNIDQIDTVGKLMAEYYTNKGNLINNFVKKNKLFG